MWYSQHPILNRLPLGFAARSESVLPDYPLSPFNFSFTCARLNTVNPNVI